MKLQPKNWDKFQQYKDRKPQWIKLQRDLLNDFSYASVRIGTKATLPLLWLLSSEYDDGVIEASVEEISFRIHIDSKTVQTAIDELLSLGFYSDLDTSVQDCTETYKMVPREEKRRDREETEKERVYIHENEKSNLLFIEYLQLRKKMKLSNSETVIKRLLSKARAFEQKGHYLDDVISNAINSSWKDFYEPKNQNQQQHKSFAQQHSDEVSNMVDTVIDNNFDPFDPRNYPQQEEIIDVQPTKRIS